MVALYCGNLEGQRTLKGLADESLRVVHATLAMGGCLDVSPLHAHI